ncbi:tetraacyldisaccharide 4'-kinase [Lampropedia aestuarii]|uniref:tetraacyldisaccharide 4'-kinase n=1 Tax=Lampropedia aestuarii TaxID=2562762 RepID=UPI0024687A29|nr:tetraacyldisaccharide 4'-kinase [Lampropedia aestuarii]MDH5857045.1 tetraacyldisaccharide 4'-kinase [Lampropedia aestuarii]
MPTWLQQLEAHWQQPQARTRLLDWLLRPLAAVYGAASARQRAQYMHGKRARTRLPVPTVVVGNVVAGGAGKTPVVIALTQGMQRRGLQVGVISRGYGRQGTGCMHVTHSSSAQQAGDEPLMIAQATQAPVFVASTRAEAALALLQAFPQTELVICDDGLQHWALERDCEVCVFPPWGVGNGRLIPAGPLREPWPRAVDVIVQSLNEGEATASIPMPVPAAPCWHLSRQLAPVLHNGLGEQRAFDALLQHPGPIVALAGIAKPQAFFAMLAQRGLRLSQTLALPDHHAFTSLPVELRDANADTLIVCTEKDAVKLWRLLPQAWAVGLEVSWQEDWTDQVLSLARAHFHARS